MSMQDVLLCSPRNFDILILCDLILHILVVECIYLKDVLIFGILEGLDCKFLFLY